MKMKSTQGFTLVELVVVIVILGILAAVALPRFSDLTSSARIASLNGMAGAIRAASSLARAQYIVNGDNTAATVTMDGVVVDVVTANGRPDGTATGIERALESTVGFGVGHALAVSTFTPDNGGSLTCQLTYTEADGVVALTTGGC